MIWGEIQSREVGWARGKENRIYESRSGKYAKQRYSLPKTEREDGWVNGKIPIFHKENLISEQQQKLPLPLLIRSHLETKFAFFQDFQITMFDRFCSEDSFN